MTGGAVLGAVTTAELIDTNPADKFANPTCDPQNLSNAELGAILPAVAGRVYQGYECNDGIMKLRIKGTEEKGSWNSKFTVYVIEGHDSVGAVEVARRYSEFHMFHEKLSTRYPGMLIPPVPPKKSSGKMEEFFILERRHYLTVFLAKLCESPVICRTPEVQVFFRPKDKSVEKSFGALKPTTTDDVLEFYTRNIRISDIRLPETTVAKYHANIVEFQKEQQVLMDYLRQFKTHIKQIVPMKQQELTYYRQFADFLQKYEDSNENSKVEGAHNHVRLVSGDSKAHLKNKLDGLAKELQNPFVHIRNWVKGEIMNLNALSMAVAGRESCEARKSAAIKRSASERDVLASLQQGKTTMRGLFKSDAGKAQEVTRITTVVQQLERDIENGDKLKRFITIYLFEVAIPNFRNKKVVKYVDAMQAYSFVELQNTQKQQSCWKEFYELTKQFTK